MGDHSPGWTVAAYAGLALGIALSACATSAPATSVIASRQGSRLPVPSTPAGSAAASSVPASSAPALTPAASSALPFSLPLPAGRDPRAVQYSVSARVPATGTGQLVVTVTNLTDRLIGELVLRWPTSLAARLSLAPFSPSMQRIADGGPPLVQPWTKWVEGPGEGGEPAGTTSLGWGPLLPRSTLVVTLVATRGEAGPVAFDLQLLTGEAILTGADGNLARTRVQVP